MKSLLVLLAIWHMSSARHGANRANMSDEDYDMLCRPRHIAYHKDVQTPLAFIKLNFHLFSFSSAEHPPTDIFLTIASRDDANSFSWYTFPERKRIGVDANGTLEVDSENSTTFKILRPCDQRYYPYFVLCASRNQSHFIVRMSGSDTVGFPVMNCEKENLRDFWRNAVVKHYLHHQVQYSSHLYLAREKCIPVRTGRCSRADGGRAQSKI